MSALYEYRVYHTAPRRMAALHQRFAEHGVPRMLEHGFQPVGYWTAEVGMTDRLHYLLRWDDMEHREQAWTGFRTDPEWVAAKSASTAEHEIVIDSHNELWLEAPYSPARDLFAAELRRVGR